MNYKTIQKKCIFLHRRRENQPEAGIFIKKYSTFFIKYLMENTGGCSYNRGIKNKAKEEE